MSEEKKSGRGGRRPGAGSPALTDKALKLKPGDNTKFLEVSMELMSLPNIDLYDVEQVNERLGTFFRIHAERDMKPTVSGLALALNGMDTRRLWEIRTGALMGGHTKWDIPQDVVVSIKKAHNMLEILWENYMQNGKINPASGIFLGKNHFGYRDQVEHVVTPNVRSESEYSEDEMKARYMLDDGDAE